MFAIGFPKSGTTTLNHALNEAGLPAAHQKIEAGFCGVLMYESLEEDENPFSRFKGYRAVTQSDVCRPQRGLNFWPQLDHDMLDAVERHNPDVKFILHRRDVRDLIRSIHGWSNMLERIVACDIPGLPAGAGATDEELAAWITGHYAWCRERFAGNPNYLEFDIADPDAPALLERFLGVPLPWWGIKLPSPRNLSRQATRRAVGDAVREARLRAGLSQLDLAERLDVRTAYVTSLEHGQSNPTVAQLWAIADALGAELSVELRRTAEPEPEPQPAGEPAAAG